MESYKFYIAIFSFGKIRNHRTIIFVLLTCDPSDTSNNHLSQRWVNIEEKRAIDVPGNEKNEKNN